MEKKAADPDTSGTHSQVVNLETSTIEPATPNNDAYIFEKADNPGPDSGTNKEKVLHWYARYMDTEPVSKCRKNRYGILTLKEPINIENERFLTFEVYVKHDDGGELSSTTCIWNCWMNKHLSTAKKAALAQQALTAQRMARSN